MGSVVKSVTGSLFGGGSSPGMLGTGQYKAKAWDIDKKAFQSPYSTSEQNYIRAQTMRSLANQEQVGRDQGAFIQQLQAAARGEAPSVAQNQLNQATNQNVAQAMGMAASQRGTNPALAARMAMQSAAQANQEAAGQGATLRAQEMAQSRGELGQALAQRRQQEQTQTGITDNLSQQDRDAKMAYQNLGVQQQTGLNSVQSQAYSDAAKRRGDFVSNIGAGIAGIFSDEKLKVEKPESGAKNMLEKFMSGVADSVKAQQGSAQSQGPGGAGKGIKALMGLLGPAAASGGGAGAAGAGASGGGLASLFASAGPGAAAASDEDNKTSIKGGSKDVQSFLDALKAHHYEYKEKVKDSPMGGDGEYVSPMAQELEKTKLGKGMVKDTPEGKVVDYGKGFGAILAAQAMLNDRMKKLEKRG